MKKIKHISCYFAAFMSLLALLYFIGAPVVSLYPSNERVDLIADIGPGQASSSPILLGSVNNKAYYLASDDNNTLSLFETSGVPNSNRKIKTITSYLNPNCINKAAIKSNNVIFFIAGRDPSLELPNIPGFEKPCWLYYTDGTEAGTAALPVSALSGVDWLEKLYVAPAFETTSEARVLLAGSFRYLSCSKTYCYQRRYDLAGSEDGVIVERDINGIKTFNLYRQFPENIPAPQPIVLGTINYSNNPYYAPKRLEDGAGWAIYMVPEYETASRLYVVSTQGIKDLGLISHSTSTINIFLSQDQRFYNNQMVDEKTYFLTAQLYNSSALPIGGKSYLIKINGISSRISELSSNMAPQRLCSNTNDDDLSNFCAREELYRVTTTINEPIHNKIEISSIPSNPSSLLILNDKLLFAASHFTYGRELFSLAIDACPNDSNKLFPGACGCGNSETDSDGDRTPDCIDLCPQDHYKIASGQCGCNLPDNDSDGDGAANCVDGCANDPLKTSAGLCGCGTSESDTDLDGTPNCRDSCPLNPNMTVPGRCGCSEIENDSDSDGTLDCRDGCPNDPDKIAPGQCNCGVSDTDRDLDGILDCVDVCPDSTKPSAGICGCNVSDIDSDSDGVADCRDQCLADPVKSVSGVCGCGVSDKDSDADGTSDCLDECPLDNSKLKTGFCGCGKPERDSDGDGSLDCFDLCPSDSKKITLGICGCGKVDSDLDKDGLYDCLDLCPKNPSKSQSGVCGCELDDKDTDLDQVLDCKDSCPLDKNKTLPGFCGCGSLETDSDNDGTPNCLDRCPNDINKIDAGSCGCGVPDSDVNSNKIIDCLEQIQGNPGLSNPIIVAAPIVKLKKKSGELEFAIPKLVKNSSINSSVGKFAIKIILKKGGVKSYQIKFNKKKTTYLQKLPSVNKINKIDVYYQILDESSGKVTAVSAVASPKL